MKLLIVCGVALLATVAYGQQVVRPDALEGLGVSDTPTTRIINGRRFAVVPVTGQAARRRQTTTTTTTAAAAAAAAAAANRERASNIPAAPLRAEADEDLGPPIPYAFNFAANNDDGGSHTREESRDASGTVTGSYTISDPDGRTRTVRYVADENGFRAEVETNEIGTETHNAAGVNTVSRAPTPAQLVAEFEAERARSPAAVPAERSRTRNTTARRRLAAPAQPAEDNESAGSRARVIVLRSDQLQDDNIVQLLRSGRARLVTRN